MRGSILIYGYIKGSESRQQFPAPKGKGSDKIEAVINLFRGMRGKEVLVIESNLTFNTPWSVPKGNQSNE